MRVSDKPSTRSSAMKSLFSASVMFAAVSPAMADDVEIASVNAGST